MDKLGVHSTPPGPGSLFKRIRALSMVESPPTNEVEKWYRSLDKLSENCSTEDRQAILHAFQTEKLILTQNGEWETSRGVFLSSSEDDIPNAEVVRSSVKHLSLWEKVGVGDRPTEDLAIEWLKTLPTDTVLVQRDIRRIGSCLARNPSRMWKECGNWLNLTGEWVPVESLSYALTMQSLVTWSHLHPWVKQKTADLRQLPTDTTNNSPFSRLTPLLGLIEERLCSAESPRQTSKEQPWITTFGKVLLRIDLDSEDVETRIHQLAERLARTKWRESHEIRVMPYIDGTPAGTDRKVDVVWINESLYVKSIPEAKLAQRVPVEIGKAFACDDIKAALDYSFGRSAHQVREYLEANFNLRPEDYLDEGKTMENLPDGMRKDGEVSENSRPLGQIESYRSSSIDEPSVVGSNYDDTETSTFGVTEGQPDVNGRNDKVQSKLKRTPKPAEPTFLDRFASAHGFRPGPNGRFVHSDGSWIAKLNSSSFPWELHTADGNLVRFYQPHDHCLQQKPLRIEADTWGLLKANPSIYALILTDVEGNAVEVSGTSLFEMVNQRELTLYPANYRLVYGKQ